MAWKKKKITEDELRRVVRLCFPKGVEWVEPAFGSSPGLPDVNIDVGYGISIPVELKMWELNKKGNLVAPMRPAQIRYHVMGARKGKRSAILYSLPVAGSSGELELFLLNGKYAPTDKIKHDVISNSTQVGLTCHLFGSIRYFICKTLVRDEFWR